MSDEPRRRSFTAAPLPTRVVFGAGRRLTLAEEMTRAGLTRVLVLSTPRASRAAADMLDSIANAIAASFHGVAMHVPVATIEEAAGMVSRHAPDGCIAIGGGSSIGLAKALVLRHQLPYVAVPTTLAGSEMTPIWGVTEDARKRTGRDEAVRPRTVIYDPELAASMPAGLAVVSGLNAIAHAAEGLYAADRSPLTDLMAGEGAAAMANALNTVQPTSTALTSDATSDALYGAWLCGTVLGSTSMGLHHKICHVLGGTFGLPHAETHATVLPHVLGFNLPVAPAADRLLSEALRTQTPEQCLWELGRRAGQLLALEQLGMRREDLEEAARIVVDESTSPTANVRPVDAAGVLHILASAYTGAPPERVT